MAVIQNLCDKDRIKISDKDEICLFARKLALISNFPL